MDAVPDRERVAQLSAPRPSTAIAAVLSVILAGLLGLLLAGWQTRWIRVVRRRGRVLPRRPVLIMMIFLFNALQLLRWFRNDVNPLMAAGRAHPL